MNPYMDPCQEQAKRYQFQQHGATATWIVPTAITTDTTGFLDYSPAVYTVASSVGVTT